MTGPAAAAKCPSGKKRFRDQIAADLALARISQRDDTSRPATERRAYSCGRCRGGWHLTSQPRRSQAPGRPAATVSTLSRSGPLPFRSKKTAARYVARRLIVAEMFAEPEICAVPWCPETATDPHEPLTRARGGDILDRDGIRKVCHPHNVMFASDEQPWMYELGFLIHSWDRKKEAS